MATRTAEKATGQTWQDEAGVEHPFEDAPITAVGYDANGEAVDVAVDTRPLAQAGLPGIEDDREVELIDGRPVTAWKYSFTGNAPVSMLNHAAGEMFNGMRVEQEFIALVTLVPGSVSYKPNTEDGHVVGFTKERKLHVTHIFAKDSDGDALFEGGLIRVRHQEPDDIGYMTTEPPPEEDEANDLASSLMAAGLCGKIHPGHLNKCRDAAHACELPEAE